MRLAVPSEFARAAPKSIRMGSPCWLMMMLSIQFEKRVSLLKSKLSFEEIIDLFLTFYVEENKEKKKGLFILKNKKRILVYLILVAFAISLILVLEDKNIMNEKHVRKKQVSQEQEKLIKGIDNDLKDLQEYIDSTTIEFQERYKVGFKRKDSIIAKVNRSLK